MKNMNRRSFLENSYKAAGISISTSIFPLIFNRAEMLGGRGYAQGAEEPHFFLMLNFKGGMDINYWFDARPLAMTADQLITNYMEQDPLVYTAGRGGTCLRTAVTSPLDPWLSKLCIINGVLMSPSFDGHDQNAALMVTGNPFGGESFIPLIAAKDQMIDYVKSGEYHAQISNDQGMLSISSDMALNLATNFKVAPATSGVVDRFVKRHGRVEHASGSAENSKKLLLAAMDVMPEFQQRLSRTNIVYKAPSGGLDDYQRQEAIVNNEMSMIEQFFLQKVCSSAMISLSVPQIDAHDPAAAMKSKDVCGAAAKVLAKVLTRLASAQHPCGKSLLDLTTVTCSSEFSRTMRQARMPITASGTDHNPLNNTVILAGKGIRGDQVIGSSDFAASGETLSGAHLQLDPERLRVMARPFNFVSGTSQLDAGPEAFAIKNYLTIQSINNTILHMYGVRKEQWQTLSRFDGEAPIIPSILM
jgi:hypothetical protein